MSLLSCFSNAQPQVIDTLDVISGYQFDGHFLYKNPINGFQYNQISKSVKILVDSTRQQKFDEILSNWKKNAQTNRLISIENSAAYWLGFTLKGSATFNGKQLFDASGAYLGWLNAEVYIVHKERDMEHFQIGFKQPLAERPHYFWANFFQVDVPIGDSVSVFLRLEQVIKNSSSKALLNVAHINPTSVWTHQPYLGLKFGLICGALGVMSFYFLLYFFITKDKVHAYFVLYLWSILFLQFIGFRKVSQFILYPSILSYSRYLLFLAHLLFFVGLLKYTEHYLKLKTFKNKLSLWINPILYAIGIISFLTLVLLDGQEIDALHKLIFLALLLISCTGYLLPIVAAFVARKKYVKLAKYFLIAFSPILLSYIFTILSAFFVSPLEHPTRSYFFLNLTDICQLLGLILLALSMGYRTNILKLQEAEALRLKDKDELKNKLYTHITHEFRTPLTLIQGMANQIEKAAIKDRRIAAKLIQRNSQNLLNLVNQMLDLSKLEDGNLSLNWVQGDVVKFVLYVEESFQSYAKMRGIDVQFFSELEIVLMDYDEVKLQQIISNLLSNAIKFTPENGKISLHLTVIEDKIESKNKYLQIQVKDSGSGIPAEQLPYIFDRFYSNDNTFQKQSNGTGIGLTLTKELVELVGGTMTAQSELGKGTEFKILLPITRKAPLQENISNLPLITLTPEANIPQIEDTNIDLSTPQPILLLIEDNPDVAFYIKSCLQNDYQMLFAQDGEKGIEKAIETVPDIIISDVMMPKKNGFIVCETLKKEERTSHIPIILLTAKADDHSKIKGLKSKADVYLTKPFQKEELVLQLKNLIEIRQQLQAKYRQFSHDLHQIKSFVIKKEEKPIIAPEEIFLKKILDILEKNYQDDTFGLPELCQVMSMSRSQLFRKLKALTGKSTTQFIRSFRLKKAKILLETTDKTVSEIAFEVGYNNLGYFSKTFLKEFGVLPSIVRN